MLLVGFFAFFHGFAHGAEMPGSASISDVRRWVSFWPRCCCTHWAWPRARLVAFVMACFVGRLGRGPATTNAPVARQLPRIHQRTIQRSFPTVVVHRPAGQHARHRVLGHARNRGRGANCGPPDSARGEILETVPGVIITQHAGGGKANQYFLRGFNLDHGTDFAIYLDDMPLNLPSHAHGEGYSDMNTVIPEFVERLDYEKGPYYADVGNYGSAGAAHLEFYKTLPQDFLTVEGGMFGFERGVFGLSQKLGPGNLLYRRRSVSRRRPLGASG